MNHIQQNAGGEVESDASLHMNMESKPESYLSRGPTEEQIGALTKYNPSEVPASIQACKTRTVLTERQVQEIFIAKLLNESSEGHKTRQSAASLARKYGVSDKTIRDIWTGRTWFRELMHLDPARKDMAERLRFPGRPKHAAGQQNSSNPVRAVDTLNAVTPSPYTSGESCDEAASPGIRPRRRPLGAAAPSHQAGFDALLLRPPPPGRPAPHTPGPATPGRDPPRTCGHLSAAPEEPPRAASCPASFCAGRASPTRMDLLALPGAAAGPGGSSELPRAAAADAADAPDWPTLPPSSRADDPFHDDWEHWA